MTMTLLNINAQDLPKISLTLSMWKKAKDFADRQVNYQKAKQVYFNTLAVLSANQYLQRTGIQTDLSNSNGYSIAMQTLLDSAELNLPEYGLIDCRPITESDQFLNIPSRTDESPILHLAVFICQDFSTAQFLGFTPQVSKERIALDELQSISDLTTFLESHKSSVVSLQPNQNSDKPELSGWLTASSKRGWSELTSQIIQQFNLNLLPNSQPSPAFRNSATLTNTDQSNKFLEGGSKIKLWELQQQDIHHRIAIIINVLQTKEDEIDISIQLFPTDNFYLPEGIIIKILDNDDTNIIQMQTTANNDKIEFLLSGQPGEVFSIQGIYEDQVQTENFVI